MGLETNFKPNASVGQLYRDVIEETKKRGLAQETLEKQINTGYIQDTYWHLTGEKVPRVNDPRKIESIEVLEYAYKNPSLYSLLVKHGFPVPFAMNDFKEVGARNGPTSFFLRSAKQALIPCFSDLPVCLQPLS